MPTEPTIGEISLFSFSREIVGWIVCDGRLLKIDQNQALFSLLGTQFGGDGRTTFAVPDLRGRVPVGANLMTSQPLNLTSLSMGEAGGQQAVTLMPDHLPPHTHALVGTSQLANSNNAQDTVYATVVPDPPSFPDAKPIYGDAINLTPFDPQTVVATGGGQAHANMQPTLTLCYMIATNGTYPIRE